MTVSKGGYGGGGGATHIYGGRGVVSLK